MNESAGMLEARLSLIDRIRRVEHTLAREEQATMAASLMRGRAHDLGNTIQIVKLSALELARRAQPDQNELVTDLRTAAEHAAALLTDLIAATRPLERAAPGPVVTHAVRAAVDSVRPAIAAPIELRIEVDDTVHTHASAEELEAIVLASALDAATATRLTFVLRERVIQGKRWIELLRIDDRRELADGELAQMFEACSLLHVVAGVSKQCGGEASLAPGRTGLELAVELPVAPLFGGNGA